MHPALRRTATILCVLLVLAVPVLVRTPTAVYPNMTEDERTAFTNEEGRYYMTDPDSYYHVRITDNHLKTGSIGDSYEEDGTPHDSRSFWPEGRSADYTTGIVLLTEAVWKPLNAVFGTSLYDVEYALAAFMSGLAGLAAFLLVRRMSNTAGGLAGGLLVSCAPAFVLRTAFSRYDTDMFAVLMDLLLILFLTEALRAKSRGKRIGFAGGFVLSAWLYAFCWTPTAVALITGFTLFGGLVYAVWNGAGKQSGILTVIGCGAAALAGLVIFHGMKVISDILAYIPLTAATRTEGGTLPSVFMLINELSVPPLIPGSFGQWFYDPQPGREISIMTGLGGAAAVLLTLAGIIWLALKCFKRFRKGNRFPLEIPESREYLGVLLVCLGSWVFLLRYGFRFIEHLAAVTGVFGGAAIGWTGALARGRKGKTGWIPAGICAVLCAVTVAPAAATSMGIISRTCPAVSRVSDKAMAWVREKAEDPDAVIASWWDYGYYYEAASGHPCLWDGGSMDPTRAILFSKAMVTHNPVLSRRILQMLSTTGNRAAEYLMERTDAETAFDLIWETLPMEKKEAIRQLRIRSGMTAEEAAEAEALLHPEKTKETYLIITDTMMQEIAWFEYYTFWDFTGETPIPLATTLRYTPGGYPYDSPEGQKYMEQIRYGETLWRLYMEEEEIDGFNLVFAGDDGTETLWMWKL